MNSSGTHWPKGVRPISWGDTGKLGIDDDNALYWDGKPVVVRKSVRLSNAQAIWAGIVSVSLVVGGFGSAAQGWVAFKSYAVSSGVLK